MTVYASLTRIITRYGETMTLKRAGLADLPVKGKRYNAAAAAIAGSMDDQALTVRITNAEIAGSANTRAPQKGDTIGGLIIIACDTRKIGETVALHILAVGG